MVVRKIEMLIEDWDQEPLAVQQTIFGRTKGTGAPLSGGEEFTAPDFQARIAGADAIDRLAHVRLAHPSNNRGFRILRRGYNYLDGTSSEGRLEGGLLFIAYQRSPQQFIAIQRALATDLLNEYIRHVGSAIFLVPPGTSRGGFVGETLFG
jgi:deferrochelatase/peroxidase EfeB